MPRMIRSLATLLILLVTATTAWGAGEREVTIAQGIDAEFLDVQMTNNVATIIINGSIYDTLLTRDKQLQIVPHLRSEEHTSELQSHHDLVCRLLLEKKKT